MKSFASLPEREVRQVRSSEMGNEDTLPTAYKYAQRVLALMESGELRLGYDRDGNALLFLTPEGDADRAVPIAMLLPIDAVSLMAEPITA
jgi:hypothetical protein